MSRRIPTFCVFIALITVSTITPAQEPDVKSVPPSLKVIFDADIAIIEAPHSTQGTLIQETVEMLKKDGISEMRLRIFNPDSHNTKPEDQQVLPSFAIDLFDDKTAEITITNDVAFKHIVSVISMLTKSGVQSIRFNPLISTATK